MIFNVIYISIWQIDIMRIIPITSALLGSQKDPSKKDFVKIEGYVVNKQVTILEKVHSLDLVVREEWDEMFIKKLNTKYKKC